MSTGVGRQFAVFHDDGETSAIPLDAADIIFVPEKLADEFFDMVEDNATPEEIMAAMVSHE